MLEFNDILRGGSSVLGLAGVWYLGNAILETMGHKKLADAWNMFITVGGFVVVVKFVRDGLREVSSVWGHIGF